MDPKPRPNDDRSLQALRAMSAEDRILRMCELSARAHELAAAGVRSQFPGLPPDQVESLVRKRMDACYNRNW